VTDVRVLEETDELTPNATPTRASRWWQGVKNLRHGMPVLIKDLTELAARRRTYIVRTVYASLLFISFAIFFFALASDRGHSLYRMLGSGKEILVFLIVIQLVGVYLFLPAMVVPSIAGEKERGTLGLLFTTDLGPWEILLQKYLSRLAPMFMFLLLSLPLMAVAYSFGGLSSRKVLVAAYVIFTTCMQVAAFALMWSTFCRNTSEATGATYAGAIILSVAMVLFSLLLTEEFRIRSGHAFIPMISVFPWMLLTGAPMGGLPTGAAVMPWGWTVLFLVLARRFLVRRAFLKKKRPKSLLRHAKDLFRFLISLRKGLRGLRTRKIHKPVGDLPGKRPITWRELASSSLRTPGSFAFTAGVLGSILVGATLLFAHWIGFDDNDRGVAPIFVVFGVWVAGALAITTKSSSIFSLERANNTLELLITTPLTGREIVAEKAAAVRRRALLIYALLGALFIIEVILDTRWGLGRNRYYRGYYGHYDSDLGQIGYLVVSFLSVPIYLWMAGWLAGWIGLRFRKQAHATGLAFGSIFGICVGPLVLAGVVSALSGVRMGRGPEWLLALSPATIVVLTELANLDNLFEEAFDAPAAVPIILNWIVCIGIGATFRSLSLRNADRYLGRPVSSGGSE